MSAKSITKEEQNDLKELEEVLKELKPGEQLYKFRNTAIYDCLKRIYGLHLRRLANESF